MCILHIALYDNAITIIVYISVILLASGTSTKIFFDSGDSAFYPRLGSSYFRCISSICFSTGIKLHLKEYFIYFTRVDTIMKNDK